MQLRAVLGKKLDQTQAFLEDGTRVPVSVIDVKGNFVSQIKTSEKEGYNSVQLAFGNKKKLNKATTGHLNKAGIKEQPRFFREIRAEEAVEIELGSNVDASTVLQPGDIVDVSGVSKGKGFAGGVKRFHFRGGPRTHGQSDRERAPGSIGQTTTPGRVYKGKRMAGRMGTENVTVKNLEVLEVKDGTVLIRGLVPGFKNNFLVIEKVGENKKFKPLYREPEEVTEEPIQAEAQVEQAEPVAETSAEGVQAEAVVEQAQPVEETVSQEASEPEVQEQVAEEAAPVEEKVEEQSKEEEAK